VHTVIALQELANGISIIISFLTAFHVPPT